MALTQIEIEVAVEEAVTNFNKIVNELWQRGYPNLKNEKLREAFRISFFLAIQERFVEKYKKEIENELHLPTLPEQTTR